MHDFDETKIMEKFNSIKEQYVDTYTPDPDIGIIRNKITISKTVTFYRVG